MKYLPINWQDGMKIRKEHFLGQEFAARGETFDLAQAGLTPFSYGLLPPRLGVPGKAFDLWFKLDQSGQMLITLTACRVIAPNGALFELDDTDPSPTLEATAQQVLERFPQATQCFVVLEVNPFERVPTGQADPEEHPPRLPGTHPHFRLKLSNIVQWAASSQGAFDITLGRIELSGAEPQLDPLFIPPSAAMVACPQLNEQYDRWFRILEELEGQCSQTLNRIRKLEEGSGEDLFSNSLAVGPIAQRLTLRILYLTSDLLVEREVLRYQPPMYFMTAVQRHARSLLNLFAELGEKSSQEWVNFLSQSIKLTDYQESIERLVKASYNHLDLKEMMATVDQYVQMLGRMYHAQRGLPTSNFDWKRMVDIGISFEDKKSDPDDIF